MAIGIIKQSTSFISERPMSYIGAGKFGVTTNKVYNPFDYFQGITSLVIRDFITYNRGLYKPSFHEDFYYRVYIKPELIDLKSVTSEVVEQVMSWNAWPDRSSSLTDIGVDNDTDISVSAEAPSLFKPTQYKVFDVRAGTSGPAEINAVIRFTFSSEEGDIVLRVIGNRVTSFPIPAEVPVSETWTWLTNTMRSVNGSEQTVSVSGGEHRVNIEYKVILDDEDDVRVFRNLLLTGIGKMFVPEWQHSSILKSGFSEGDTELTFDKMRCDVRAGEFAMIYDEELSSIVQISELTSTGAVIVQPQTVSFNPKTVRIIPGATGIIGDTKINRRTVDYSAEVSLSAKLQRYRDDISRPLSTPEIELFMGMPVLNMRHYGETIDDNFNQELIDLDNGFGVFDVKQDISFPRESGTRKYTFSRVKDPEKLDFWKGFSSIIRGSARPFLLRSYRADYKVINGVTGGLFSITVSGTDYAQKVFSRFPTHRIFRVENSSGEHAILRVVDSNVDGKGLNSVLVFDVALPSGYTDVKVIEQLMPVRIEGDAIKWQHTSVMSNVEFGYRSTMTDGV